MKKYFKILFIVFSGSIVFYACSKDEVIENNSEQLTAITKNSLTKKESSTLEPNMCDIVGNLSVSIDTYTYSYTNNGGNTNITWTISPSTYVQISGQGTPNINLTFLAGFNGCTLKASGTGGIDGCEKTVIITKQNVQTVNCSCAPIFANEFYNNPDIEGYVENAIYFGKRLACPINWSTVTSVTIQIGGVFGVGSNSSLLPNINTMGQTGGFANNSNWTTTPSGFRNIKIRTHLNTSNVDPGFLRNNTLAGLGGWATIKFNNGCPDVMLYLNDDPDLSPI